MRSRFISRQSRRFTEKRHLRRWVGSVSAVLAIASWLFVLSRLSSLSTFTIQAVNVSGADSDIAPSLQAVALQAIQGDYAGLFSKSNSFIYPRKKIRLAVESASPRIESVSVRRDGLSALVISVVEKAPAATVCASLPDFDDAGQPSSDPADCYFADATGRIFATASSSPGVALHRYYVPALSDSSSATTSLVGQYATSTGEFQALQSFYDGARQAGLDPRAILIKDSGEYELYALASDMVVYFNDSRPLPEELSNLTAFWITMTDAARAKKEKLDLDSIDVRYGSNVFYRVAK